MAIPPVISPWRVDLDRYHELIEQGWFREEDRVELIEGVLTQMSPKGARHERAISLLVRQLVRDLDPAFELRVQSALTLAPSGSEPEPDLALVPPEAREPYHPATAALVIEVAHSSLAYDRLTKLRIFAAAMIPEYWIVNLVDSVAEVHRDPDGKTYGNRWTVSSGVLSPLAVPAVQVDLDSLFAGVAATPATREGE